jgi:hypothetical protein
MGGHDQMRQAWLRGRNGCHRGEVIHDTVGPKGREQVKLSRSCGCRPLVSEIDDVALVWTIFDRQCCERRAQRICLKVGSTEQVATRFSAMTASSSLH